MLNWRKEQDQREQYLAMVNLAPSPQRMRPQRINWQQKGTVLQTNMTPTWVDSANHQDLLDLFILL